MRSNDCPRPSVQRLKKQRGFFAKESDRNRAVCGAVLFYCENTVPEKTILLAVPSNGPMLNERS